MSGFVKHWPERLIKSKSQRYERPGTTSSVTFLCYVKKEINERVTDFSYIRVKIISNCNFATFCCCNFSFVCKYEIKCCWKNKRPGTTAVKPRKETGKINVRDNKILLHRSSFPYISLSLWRKISLVIPGISFCRALPNRDFTVCVARTIRL